MPYSLMGAEALGFAAFQPFGAYPWQAYLQPGGWWQLPPLLVVGGALGYSVSCPTAVPVRW